MNVIPPVECNNIYKVVQFISPVLYSENRGHKTYHMVSCQDLGNADWVPCPGWCVSPTRRLSVGSNTPLCMAINCHHKCYQYQFFLLLQHRNVIISLEMARRTRGSSCRWYPKKNFRKLEFRYNVNLTLLYSSIRLNINYNVVTHTIWFSEALGQKEFARLITSRGKRPAERSARTSSNVDVDKARLVAIVMP